MMLNRVWLAAVGMTALAWCGPSAAQQYRADEFLSLDLSRAVFSPKPLGPAASFSPGPLDVTIDRGKGAAQANAELAVDPKTVPTSTVHAENRPATTAVRQTAIKQTHVAHARVERVAPRKPRALIALHGRNPMESQARDTSVQVWPCRTGGICNWKR